MGKKRIIAEPGGASTECSYGDRSAASFVHAMRRLYGCGWTFERQAQRGSACVCGGRSDPRDVWEWHAENADE